VFKIPKGEEFLKKCYDHQSPILYIEAKKYCKEFRIAVDAGGHVGFFSARMVEDFNQVHTFEPFFGDILAENVTKDNLKLHRFGLSSKNTKYNFHVKTHHTGMSKIDPKGSDMIECKTLDSMKLRNVDLLKIHVERHELDVLYGSSEFFKNNDPVIIIETKERQVVKHLKNLGYTQVFHKEDDYIFTRRQK